MPQQIPALHHTIVVVDVAGFTDPFRGARDRMAVHEGMYAVLKTAFADSDIDFDYCEREDRGDGAMILVPASVSKSIIADLLPERLVVALRRYNATRERRAQFRLKVALHAGDVRRTENGWVGPAIDLAFRILDSAGSQAALWDSDRLVALISSDSFFAEVIEPDPGTVPEEYRQIPVSVKTFTGTAWLRLLGSGSPVRPPPPIPTQEPVLDLFPFPELDSLRHLLTGTEIPRMAVLMSRAVGPELSPYLRHDLHNAWDVVHHLTNFNAGPDGIPPALLFLDLLASELGGAAADLITDWVDQQAHRLRLLPSLLQRQHLIPDAVAAFVNEELSTTAHSRAESHIDVCARCADAVTFFRQATREAVALTTRPDQPPVSSARVRLRSTDPVLAGQPAEIDFAFVPPEHAEKNAPMLPRRVRLRILLQASGASVWPMTRIVDLDVDRTSEPVRFEIMPTEQGTVHLAFRVYLARDGQLLQEVHASLPVPATLAVRAP